MKEKLITVRISEDKHAEFKLAADLIGVSMSALLHQYVVKVIKEQRAEHPEAFAQSSAEEPKPSAPKIVRSTEKVKDWIDGYIDAASSDGGEPVSEVDRERLRKIVEEFLKQRENERLKKKESP